MLALSADSLFAQTIEARGDIPPAELGSGIEAGGPVVAAEAGEVAGTTDPDWYSNFLEAPNRYLGLPDLSQPRDLVQEGTLTLYLDNDMFGGTDENYTNGFRLSWISADLRRDQLPGLQGFLSDISEPLRWRKSEDLSYSMGVSLTQLMFTPEDIQAHIPDPNQRPYAGYLGLGFSAHTKSETALDSFELAVGTTGENSLAETTQDFIHSLKDVERANGWDYQIPNELTLNLHYTHRELLYDLGDYEDPFRLEVIGNYGGDLGNFLTQARVGADLRVGYHLPPEYTYNSVDVNAYTHQLFGSARKQQGNWSFFAGTGFEGRAVGWNITLDGAMFSDSPSVDKRPFVAEFYGNFGVRWRDLTFSYQHTLRTEEYEGQGDPQIFGSIAIGWSF